jgi:pimeloyl-ACP methyl ester carboxylesterase
VRALMLPGLASIDDDRAGVGLADHVAAVIEAIDDTDTPVALVGHSGGGAIAQRRSTRGRIGSPASCTSTRCRSATAA